MVVVNGPADRESLLIDTEKTYDPGAKVKDDMDHVANVGSVTNCWVVSDVHGRPPLVRHVQANTRGTTLPSGSYEADASKAMVALREIPRQPPPAKAITKGDARTVTMTLTDAFVVALVNMLTNRLNVYVPTGKNWAGKFKLGWLTTTPDKATAGVTVHKNVNRWELSPDRDAHSDAVAVAASATACERVRVMVGGLRNVMRGMPMADLVMTAVALIDDMPNTFWTTSDTEKVEPAGISRDGTTNVAVLVKSPSLLNMALEENH